MTTDRRHADERGQRRIERDSMGELEVAAGALWGAQTQRAIANFSIGGMRLPVSFIHAVALIKRCAADANRELGLLDPVVANAIQDAALEIERGDHEDAFPIDVFQTGSGTSTNMNVNEVIARLAEQRASRPVHPNDDVNMGQSSNDVVPAAIHISAYVELERTLVPMLEQLAAAIDEKARRVDHVVVTGRTHLMDALPLRLSQELGGWRWQIGRAIEALRATAPRLAELPLGGTAVGTGLNAHPAMGRLVIERIARATTLPFVPARDRFALQSSQDTAVEISGQLRVVAVALTKVCNDLRWMNSGPHCGLGEIALPPLQPGSSMMPGKVNPVIPEAVLMACARVVGNDVTITLGGQAGSFQLNTMLPLVAHCLHESLGLLARAAQALTDRTIPDLVVQEARIASGLDRNPILVTALSPIIGYEQAARIAQRAQSERRPVRDVAAEMTDLPPEQLDRLLDPRTLTTPGIR